MGQANTSLELTAVNVAGFRADPMLVARGLI
jgi:hypothetical protein